MFCCWSLMLTKLDTFKNYFACFETIEINDEFENKIGDLRLN